MVLGDGQIAAAHIVLADPPQKIAAVEQTVTVGGSRSGADFDKVLIIDQAHRRISTVGKEVGKEDRRLADQSPGSHEVGRKPRCLREHLRPAKGAGRSEMGAGRRGRQRLGGGLAFTATGKGDAAGAATDGVDPDLHQLLEQLARGRYGAGHDC